MLVGVYSIKCVCRCLQYKDNLIFVMTIIFITIIIIVIMVKLGLNSFASHVGIFSVLPKLQVGPPNSLWPTSVTSLLVELLVISSTGARDISLSVLRFLGALNI